MKIFLLGIFLGYILPNPVYTPGLVSNMTLEQICHTSWRKEPRSITIKNKMNVSKYYNIPWENRADYEYDHLIPKCIGGADSEKNLFPQRRTGPWNAYMKDRLEIKTCKMICKGELDLKKTQNAFASNWVSLYRQLFP